jgi:polyhydroxyalkanoate synthase subunit PhaC
VSIEALVDVENHDNPETIRLKKYVAGAHLVPEAVLPEVGRTPKELVWTKNKARLYHYQSEREKKHPVPILLLYALILRPYILDLVPGNSFVEYLIGRGFDVYMLDWGIPGDEDKDLSFEHYVLDYLPRAVNRTLRDSHAENLTLFGYCQGGTIGVMYASLFPGEHLKNLVLLAAPVDFAPASPLTPWTREGLVDPHAVVEAFGIVPAGGVGDLPQGASQILDPLVGWARLSSSTSQARFTETFLAASRWVDDTVPFAGEAFRGWIEDFYRRNKLAKGELELRGRRVDLSNVECPILNIAGSKDRICPLPQAEATMELVSSPDKRFLALDAGHVGLIVGPAAREEMWPCTGGWLELRSGARSGG